MQYCANIGIEQFMPSFDILISEIRNLSMQEMLKKYNATAR